MKTVFLSVIGLMFGPAAVAVVWAAELPVGYMVDFKTIKKNLASGEALTFELHTDNACTAAVHSEIILAGSENLVLEKVITR